MARIFIAIRFNDEFKEVLVAIQNTLKERGSFDSFDGYSGARDIYAYRGDFRHEV